MNNLKIAAIKSEICGNSITIKARKIDQEFEIEVDASCNYVIYKKERYFCSFSCELFFLSLMDFSFLQIYSGISGKSIFLVLALQFGHSGSLGV